MPLQQAVPLFRPGDLRHEDLNALGDGIAEVQRNFADITTQTRPYKGPDLRTETFTGIIQGAGPNGEGDYTGPNYWVGRGITKTGIQATDVYDATLDTLPISGPQVVTATNLAELAPSLSPIDEANFVGSHLLQPGQKVTVLRLKPRAQVTSDGALPGAVPSIYIFALTPPAGRFIITGNASRPGVYTAKPFTQTNSVFDVSGSAAVINADLGTSGATLAYLINRPEINKDPAEPSQHDLPADTIVTGTYLCPANDANGTAVFEIDSMRTENCSG
jgi:hypothetical protein